MSGPFAITTTTNTISLDNNRQGQISFLVSNTTNQVIHSRAKVVSQLETANLWLKILGESERDIASAGSQQYIVQITVPPNAPVGDYTFHLNIVDVANPDDNFSEGPTVKFGVAAPPPAPKPFPWWIVIVAAAVLLLLLGIWGIFVYINRSTPAKALTTTCSALKNGDYTTAYNQFATALKSRLGPEQTWAAGRQQDYSNQGGLTDCTFTNVSENGMSATASATLIFAHTKIEHDTVRLLNENGSWVIQKTFFNITKGNLDEFPLPNVGSVPIDIVTGPDGNLWFTESSGNRIGRINSGSHLTDMSGAITEFPVPTASSTPWFITTGRDGNLWFAEYSGNKIGRITPNGTITEFPLLTPNSQPIVITTGRDGNLWFTEYSGNKIGRITPSGTITEFPLTTANSVPWFIVAGPDGNLWFTEYAGNKIGRITPSGTVTEFPLPTATSSPVGITTGPDGNLWFTELSGNKIGHISLSGTVTEFPLPTATSQPVGITTGPDGNLWFTEFVGNKIGRITPSGIITEFPLPTTANSSPVGITTGPDGNLWFAEYTSNKIGRIAASQK